MTTDMDTVISMLRDYFPNGDEDFIPKLVAAMDLHSRKNYDYANGGEALGNFNRVSDYFKKYPGLENCLTKPSGVALIYMLKQFDAVLHQISQNYSGKVEGVNERLFDVTVYSVLMGIMIEREAQYLQYGDAVSCFDIPEDRRDCEVS